MAIVIFCSRCGAVLRLMDTKTVEQVLSIAREQGWTEVRRGWACPEHPNVPQQPVIEMPRLEAPKQ